MKKSFICCFALLMFVTRPAFAELSVNPWVEPNTPEDIAEVYNNSGMSVSPSDIPGTYTRVQEKKSSGSGFIAKIKGMFSSEKHSGEVANVVSQPDPNQQVLARRRSLSGRKKTAENRSRKSNANNNDGILGGIDVPSVDFSGIVSKVKGFF